MPGFRGPTSEKTDDGPRAWTKFLNEGDTVLKVVFVKNPGGVLAVE